MKRLLILLAVCLLLAGCTVNDPGGDDTTQHDSETTEQTRPGIYLPGSEIEQLTGGAVRAYPLGGNCTGIKSMGDGLLVFFRQEHGTRLLLLAGEQCRPVYETAIPAAVDPQDPGVVVSENGVGYFDEAAGRVVFLNAQLQEVSRVALPQDAKGKPVPAVSMEAFYYCTASELRVLELQTGISRLLRAQNGEYQGLLGSCFDGSVLICEVLTKNGAYQLSFVSSDKGAELGTDDRSFAMESAGDNYFISRAEGSVQELLFGSRTAAAQVLTASRDEEQVCGLPALNAAVGCLQAEELRLNYYDLTTGKITASVSLQGLEEPGSFTGDGQGFVWFTAYDPVQQQDVLYRWTVADSPAEDPAVYISPMYTPENPDAAGLQACRDMAQRMEDMFGVDVNIDLADIPVPDGYALEGEFHVQAFRKGLIRLESIFTGFPQNFFRTLTEGRASGKLHIGLVRSIAEGVDALHYRVGSDAYIVIALGEGFEQSFYHELYYVIDSKVIGNSTVYDSWSSLNPYGFDYDYDYDSYADRTDSRYLEGSSRAFIDSFSMTFPTEDRARIFEYAMMAGNEAYFQSDIMQEKLETICTGIRKAFGLKKDERLCPWAQYLN